MYVLPEDLRGELKQPYGPVVERPTKKRMSGILRGRSPVVCVGDMVTFTLGEMGLHLDVGVVDYKTCRTPFEEADVIRGLFGHRKRVCNEAGTISDEAYGTIKEAMGYEFPLDPPLLIEVEGEEDLLLIPVVMYAPDNAVLLYGQPGEGMVVVRPEEGLRKKMASYLETMEEYYERG